MLTRSLLIGVVASLSAASVAAAADPIAEVHIPPSGFVTTKVTLQAGKVYPMEITGTRKKERVDSPNSTHYVSFQDAFFCYDTGEHRDFDCPDPKPQPSDQVVLTARTAEPTSKPLGAFLADGEPSRINPAWKHPPYRSSHTYSVNFRPDLSGKLTLITSETCTSAKCTGDGFDVKIFAPEGEPDPCARPPVGRAAAVSEVRVAAVQPDVAVHRAGTPEECLVPATKDMVLQQGDEIGCDPDGSITLQFADNSTVVIKNTSQLKIASFFTEGGVVKTLILLKMGEVAAKVHKSEATKSDFRIKAPTGTASVRGTDFSVFYDPGAKAMTTTVREGVVEVDPAKAGLKTVQVRAGKEVEVTATSMTKIAKTGKAGARAGLNRRDALDKVVKVIARGNGPCGVTTPRSGAFAVRPAKRGWAVSVKILGKLTGTSSWGVTAGRVTPSNALAKKIARRCS